MPASPRPVTRPRHALLARVLVVSVCVGAAVGGAAALTLVWFDHHEPSIHLAIILASTLAAVVSIWAALSVLGRRLGRLGRMHGAKRGAPSPRGDDEDLGRAIAAVDRLLAQAERNEVLASGEGETILPLLREESGIVRAPAADAAASHEDDLEQTLAARTTELEQRLRERALLFEFLRESVSSLDLDVLLQRLAHRLGTVLELRELVILLAAEEGRFVVRSSWGFSEEGALVGRALEAGQGLTSTAIATGKPVILDDVTMAPDYLAFWGEVPRTGSFMSVPIRLRERVIGAIALTRPPDDPLTDLEARFLSALADQVALAIHNAQLFAKLEELSTIDELTRLPNRRYLNSRLEREMAEAARYEHPLSLLMIDIDHFKKLNDRAGHPIGDEALVLVAERLRGALRSVDTVARWGGEEFVALLAHANEREATQVAEKLREAILEIDTPWSREQPGGHLTLSVGVAEWAPGEDGAQLVQRADRAVYVSKRAGRNCVSRPPMPSPLVSSPLVSKPGD